MQMEILKWCAVVVGLTAAGWCVYCLFVLPGVSLWNERMARIDRKQYQKRYIEEMSRHQVTIEERNRAQRELEKLLEIEARRIRRGGR